jgi:hypothetical protein
MKHVVLAVMVALGTLALAQESHAAACANGVYRAGCVGPNGAAVVHKSTPAKTWGLLRQGGQPGGMRRTQWGRGCQKAILAPWGDSTGGHQRVGPPPSCCAFGLVGILL